jgi:hypothetical protein
MESTEKISAKTLRLCGSAVKILTTKTQRTLSNTRKKLCENSKTLVLCGKNINHKDTKDTE